MEAVERPGTLGHQVFAPIGQEAQHFPVPASGSTVGSRSLRQAANAVAKASSSSFLRALPMESACTRAESLGGTFATDSPAAVNLWARCRPRPPAFSTAQRRSQNRFAQRSSALKPSLGSAGR